MIKELFSQTFFVLKYLIRWTLIITPVAIAIGTMVAFFLWLLNWAINFRFQHNWLLYLLPLAGIVIHFLYKWYGRSSERGNNLIIDEIHQPGAGVPKRMAPLILATTVITHLFGGSAGREGTAVQMGGSLANLFGTWFNMDDAGKQVILTAGIAAGFAAVFGTPLTGTIFAIEVIAIGRIKYNSLFPCLIAGLVANFTVSAWGIAHTPYHITFIIGAYQYFTHHIGEGLLLVIKIIGASAVFGFASFMFIKLAHGVKSVSLKFIKIDWLIPVCGGLLIIALTFLIGKPDYLSLGVNAEYPKAVTIVSAFIDGGADFFSWFWKMIYTAITLGTGFKGGEVTPLFYIGSTLGNTLAGILSAPVGLFAALGFIAVFAGATNTPLACTVMGIELFGVEYTMFFAIACFTAYFFSGQKGIYSTQTTLNSKTTGTSNGYWNKRFSKYKIRD